MNIVSKQQFKNDLIAGLSIDKIAKKYHIDRRIIVRFMSGYGLLQKAPTNLDMVKLRIRDTPRGRFIAECLELEVNVIYPQFEDLVEKDKILWENVYDQEL